MRREPSWSLGTLRSFGVQPSRVPIFSRPVGLESESPRSGGGGAHAVSSTEPTARPKVALLMPPARRDEVFTADVLERLTQWADLVIPDGDTASLGYQLPALLPSVDACLTGWGAPPLPVDLLPRLPGLGIIAHAAGSIKGLIPVEALQQGIVVACCDSSSHKCSGNRLPGQSSNSTGNSFSGVV